ncbi:metallophosphoesterase family protein [Actinoplanes xinjiangensis]|uniref:Calcineurin-like phosphoesterase family protein n=1 Tax=Actinoplanes xinjiangensis TaxID=512350 RepID=A0A316FD64_9ACTN|nr:metallophosphoesterase [Actinoplanes xinjiangensis]PWK45114.1 calcineurin-like phosphoesterase family protein [Actinoplanes xinjiangensis]GIF41551.1 phosphohydrolase [Actinoplanes xinjiangensis]
MTATHRILHLSDPHVTGSGIDEDGVDAAGALDRILYDARFVKEIDVVLVTGDIADDGSAEGCAAVLQRVGAFARERGIPHVYTTGNHDAREPFAKVFGSAHLGPDGADLGESGPDRAAVSEVAGLRIVTLDSLVPGAVHGVVGEDQLDWLSGVLSRPAPAGTVVALHHPPIAIGTSPSMADVNLRNGDRLAQVLAGSDVRAVLCGHYHAQVSGFLAGIPVWVTPGVVTRIDLTAPSHLVRGVLGAGATVVDLGGPFSPMFHVLQARDPRAGEQVYLIDTRSDADAAGEE